MRQTAVTQTGDSTEQLTAAVLKLLRDRLLKRTLGIDSCTNCLGGGVIRSQGGYQNLRNPPPAPLLQVLGSDVKVEEMPCNGTTGVNFPSWPTEPPLWYKAVAGIFIDKYTIWIILWTVSWARVAENEINIFSSELYSKKGKLFYIYIYLYIYIPGNTAPQPFPRYLHGIPVSVISPKYEKEKTSVSCT